MHEAVRRLRLWLRRCWSLLSSLTPYPFLALCLLLLVVSFVGYYGSLLAHEATYQWQVDGLGSVISPVYRATCPLPEAAGVAAGALNIAILVIYDAAFWDKQLSEQSVENKRQYARMHGYTVIVANDLLDRSRPGAWSKLLAVKTHLENFDYVMYMDVDALIMNFDRKIEDLIVPMYDITMATDWNGPNTGVWIAKNTDWTRWFLQEAWDQDQFTQHGYPFEYEQRAVHYLLRTKIWKDRRLPKYPGDIADIRRRVYLMDQCVMNSYAVHPLYMKADRQVSHYVDGDFVIHFAGKKGKIKVDLMRQYLELARQKWQKAKGR